MDELRKLMSEWEECGSKHSNPKTPYVFVSDGIINENEFGKARKKVLFLLKEAYGGQEGWSLSQCLNRGEFGGRIWAATAEWAYAILNTSADYIPSYNQMYEEFGNSQDELRRMILPQIAVMNIKKYNGNTQSDYYDLLRYASRDSAKIRRELKLINPDVIICGSTFDLLRVALSLPEAIPEEDLFVDEKNEKASKKQIDGRIADRIGCFERHNAASKYEWYYSLSELPCCEDMGALSDTIVIEFYHPANQYPSLFNYYALANEYQQALKQKRK